MCKPRKHHSAANHRRAASFKKDVASGAPDLRQRLILKAEG
jgi:hypothetical protein